MVVGLVGEPNGRVDHVYEIPLTLAERVVGYRSGSEAAEKLEYVGLVVRPTKPWWRTWPPASAFLLVLGAIVGLVVWRSRRMGRKRK